MSHFLIGKCPQQLLFPACLGFRKNILYFQWKSRMQNCLANTTDFFTSQGPLACIFAWACHGHCNRQDFMLTFTDECISFQSNKMWAAVWCWYFFLIFQPILESGSGTQSELLTSVYFQLSSRNFSWGLCLLA